MNSQPGFSHHTSDDIGSASSSVKPRKFLIIAGEPSGDKHAANLIRAVKNLSANCSFFGIGGELMRKEGMEILFPVEKMAILGFVEVIKHLPFIRKVFNRLIREVEKQKPDALILVDYPGFNIRFAEKVRKKFGSRVKILYYISPQVWAWKKKRIYTISRNIDAIAVVFRFEEEIYKETGVKVRFVGHPLLESFAPESDKEIFYSKTGLNPDNTILALLPGSRIQEIERHLPVMVKAAEIINGKIDNLQVVIGKVEHISESMYQRCFDGSGLNYVLTEETYNVMCCSNIMIVSSGTATLESALSGTPFVIIYKMSAVTYRIAKRLVKLPYIGLANIVHGRKVAPELIQNDAEPEKISGMILNLLSDREAYNNMSRKLNKTTKLLGNPGAANRTAELLFEILE